LISVHDFPPVDRCHGVYHGRPPGIDMATIRSRSCATPRGTGFRLPDAHAPSHRITTGSPRYRETRNRSQPHVNPMPPGISALRSGDGKPASQRYPQTPDHHRPVQDAEDPPLTVDRREPPFPLSCKATPLTVAPAPSPSTSGPGKPHSGHMRGITADASSPTLRLSGMPIRMKSVNL